MNTTKLTLIALVFAATAFSANDLQAQASKAAAPATTPASATAPKAAGSYVENLVVQGKAIEMAMNVERIAKAFTQLQLGLMDSRSKRQIIESINEFEADLAVAQKAAPTAQLKDTYGQVQGAWDSFKAAALKPASKDQVTIVADQADRLVGLTVKGAKQFEAHFKSPRAALVETAGEVRVLIQRIAKMQMFQAAGLRPNAIKAEARAAEAEYRRLVEILLKSPENKGDVGREIAIEETQWIFLRDALAKANQTGASSKDLETIGKTADNITEVMGRVVDRFERAA
jgi:hypothetical protein